MPQFAYEYDPHCSNEDNVIRGERHLLQTQEGIVQWHHPLNTKKNSWPAAVVYSNPHWGVPGTSKGIHSAAGGVDYRGNWGAFKRINFPTGKAKLVLIVDDPTASGSELYIDGVAVTHKSTSGSSTIHEINVSPGVHDVCISVANSTGTTYCAGEIYDNGQVIDRTDTSWKAKPIVSGDTTELKNIYDYRIVVPAHAPFYYKSVREVRLNGTKLTEGVDYYYGNRYELGTVRTARIMYGSIVFIIPRQNGLVEIDYHTLGANYGATGQQLIDYLETDYNPILDTWEDIVGDIHFQQVDVNFDRDAWYGEIKLSDKIREVGDYIEQKDPREDEVFRLLDEWITSLQDLMLTSPLQNHQDNKADPHNTEWYEAGALKTDGVADNAAKAYGRTKESLADWINAQGITQTDLDRYVTLRGNKTLTGGITLSDYALAIDWHYVNGGSLSCTLDLRNGEARIRSNSTVKVVIDSDKNDRNAALEIKSGANVLKVASTAAPDKNALTLNGKKLIHTGNLDDHVSDDIEIPFTLVTRSSATLTITGKGTNADPLRMTAAIPNASTSVRGAGYLANDDAGATSSRAITARLASVQNSRVANMVPNSFKINNIPMSSNMRLTPASIGLGNVDNISDTNMPANDQHLALLANKSPVEHEHTFSDLGVADASTSGRGIAETSDDIQGASTTDFLATEAVDAMVGKVNELWSSVATTLPNDVIDITKYGESGYLPMPVQGAYEGMGFYNVRKQAAFIERDGRIIVYRNGYDINVLGVWYAYATILSDGSLTDYVSTTTKYRPGTLPDDHEIVYTGRSSDTAMEVAVKFPDGSSKRGIALFNGTGNGEMHTVAYFKNDESFSDWIPHVYKDHVYIVASGIGNGAGIAIGVYRIPLASFDEFGPVEPQKLSLSGTNAYGQAVASTNDFKYVARDWSDTNDGNMVCWRKDPDFSMNVRWNQIGIGSAREGPLLRFLYSVGTYDPAAHTAPRSRWIFSHTINLDTLVCAPDPGQSFPYIFNGDNGGGTYSGGPIQTSNNYGIHGKGGNVGVMEYADPNTRRIVIATTYNETVPQLLGCALLLENQSYFDSLQVGQRNYRTAGSYIKAEGSAGSVTGAAIDNLAYLPNRHVYTADGGALCKYEANHLFPNGYYGFGPTTNRKLDSDRYKYRMNCYVTDGNTEACYGGILTGSRRSSWIEMNPTTLATSGSISISSSAFNNLQAAALAEARKINANVSTVRLTIYALKDTRIPTCVSIAALYNDNGSAHSVMLYHYLNNANRFGDVGNPTLGAQFKQYLVVSRYASISDQDARCTNAGVYITGNDAVFAMNAQPIPYSGNGQSTVFTLNISAGTLTYVAHDYDLSYAANTYLVTKEYGLVKMDQHNSMSAVWGDVRGKTKAEWVANVSKQRVVLQSVNPAEGWSIYFTQETPLFIGSTMYRIPVSDIDLKSKYPTTHAGNRFYLYATIDGGTPHYEVLETLVADSQSSIYIGDCVTGDSGITSINVNAALRLGTFRELEEHIEDERAHGFSLDDVTKEDAGLGLLENKSMKHNLVIPSFKDVFDSWYRFSHASNGNFPANAAELNTWEYLPATDAIRNTTNSSSFIGMVSNEAVGDYDFETTVSSINADDDWIGVVLGFVEIDGREYTLTAVSSGTDTRNYTSGIVINFGQSADFGGGIYLHRDTVSFKHGWDTLGTRKISVKRRGDIFTVTFGKYSAIPESKVITWTVDCTSRADLQKFRGAVRFGYCAHSQAHSTWVNHVRPDEDGKNYYASLKLLNDTSRWEGKVKTLAGYAQPQALDVNWNYIDIPLPAGTDPSMVRAWVAPVYVVDTYGGLQAMEVKYEVNSSRVRVLSHSRQGIGANYALQYNIKIFNDKRLL